MSDLKFTLDPAVEQYEHDIRRFVDAMLYKLKIHAGKGRWQEKTVDEAFEGIRGEMAELFQAIEAGNTVEIMLESADVANFAMILASIQTERGK